MRTKSATPDLKTICAARNAREGLINVLDLSLLTGVEPVRLTSLAKKGFLGFYGEYHGKRFFKFQEIVNWAMDPSTTDEAKIFMRERLDTTMQRPDCPYSFELPADSDQRPFQVQIVWKECLDLDLAA